MTYNSEQFKQIWEEWIQYRKEQKFPAYKPTGLKRTLTALYDDSGGDEQLAIRMIINAMKNTWRGIFKINERNNQTQSGANALLERLRNSHQRGNADTFS